MPKTLLLADDSVTIQKVVGISFANEDVALLTVDNGAEYIIYTLNIHTVSDDICPPDGVQCRVNP